MSEAAHPIYHLRNANLDPKLAAMLWPFIHANRPHDDIPERELLGDRIPNESPCGMEQLTKDVGIDYNNWKAKHKKQV